MPTPLVSVVMPFKDTARFMGEAIDSVLGQSWEGLELVLVDDGGSDGSDEIAERRAAADARIRIVSHEGRTNRGIGPSRALGIRRAAGEFVAFLDGDDMWEPGHVSAFVHPLLAHPEADMACGRVWEWRSWRSPGDTDTLSRLAFAPGAVVPGARLLAAVLRDGDLATTPCALLARTSALQECLPHLELFPGAYEDQVMNSCLQLRGAAVMTGATSAWYRHHPASFSARHAEVAGGPDSARTAFLSWLRSHVQQDPRADPELLMLTARELLRIGDLQPPGAGAPTRGLALAKARHAYRWARQQWWAHSGPGVADRYRARRLDALLFRRGADIRGEVLQLGGQVRIDSSHMSALDFRPWHIQQGEGPRHDWATLEAGKYDCIVVLPEGEARRPGPLGLRHLRRALRPAGVLLVSAGPAEAEALTTDLYETFGRDAVSVDRQLSPGPAALPLGLFRAAVPAA